MYYEDPGLGKSQMLKAVCSVAPRGVYVTGGTTLTTGLTVTMERDKMTGDQALEAGALVLADKGVCCIDEVTLKSICCCHLIFMRFFFHAAY